MADSQVLRLERPFFATDSREPDKILARLCFSTTTYVLVYLIHRCSSIVCSQFVLDLFPVCPTDPVEITDPLNQSCDGKRVGTVNILRAEQHTRREALGKGVKGLEA